MYSPAGGLLGIVIQERLFPKPLFLVLNTERDEAVWIKGLKGHKVRNRDVVFRCDARHSDDQAPLGIIARLANEYKGPHESKALTETFFLMYDKSLNPRCKAMLLAAAFFINSRLF